MTFKKLEPVPEAEQWVHGSRFGRKHRSLRKHLHEDHGVPWQSALGLSDGGAHGRHDGLHRQTWAYAKDLPHRKED